MGGFAKVGNRFGYEKWLKLRDLQIEIRNRNPETHVSGDRL
jgi:hypothetical protein